MELNLSHGAEVHPPPLRPIKIKTSVGRLYFYFLQGLEL